MTDYLDLMTQVSTVILICNSNTNINIEGAPTANYIIICTLDNAKKNGQKCPRKLGLERPAYLVKWSRFGNVTKYKWSGSDWNRQ